MHTGPPCGTRLMIIEEKTAPFLQKGALFQNGAPREPFLYPFFCVRVAGNVCVWEYTDFNLMLPSGCPRYPMVELVTVSSPRNIVLIISYDSSCTLTFHDQATAWSSVLTLVKC